MAKHKQQWNWTPKARAWWFNIKLTALLLAVTGFMLWQIWNGWGNG